ncbi:MAG TPA: DUF4159 domain-containing protein [Chthoniobacterales bacterium]|jgi:hypothetical protein
MNTLAPASFSPARFGLNKSPFFVLSLLFHFLIVLFFGGKALIKQAQEEPEVMTSPGEIVSGRPEPASQPPSITPPRDQLKFTVSPTQASAAPANPAITSKSAMTDFLMHTALAFAPSQSPATVPIGSTAPGNPGPNGEQMSRETRADISAFTADWRPNGSGSSKALRDQIFRFTAYVAKYSGGDWASTVSRTGDKITGGSLPNLLYLMKTQSKNKIDATPDPEAIDLASDKLFSVRPPFLFFTGHQDFVLTDKEVENLRRYLRLGGCVWGDSSLPGQRSRFDIAFRREMKRVLPDVDKSFEVLPKDHPIYTKTYYKEITAVPPGMNGYQEPVYAIHYHGEVAVLYTANDYGDMWQIGLDSKWQVDLRKNDKLQYVAINPSIWDNRETYFRGLEPEKIANTFKFGTNIVIHLLTRWESKVRDVGAL